MNYSTLKLLSFSIFLAACQTEAAPNIGTDNGATNDKADNAISQWSTPSIITNNLSDLNMVNIQEVARSEWGGFVQRLNIKIINQLGFSSAEELLTATIGPAIPQLNLDLTSTSGIQTECSIWRVPILIDGQMRILLTIAPQDGKYHIVDMGGVQLAHKIQQLTVVHHDTFTNQKLYILRSHQLVEDYLGPLTIKDQKLTNTVLAPITRFNPELKSTPRLQSLEEVARAANEAQP